jgi:hypothetical protein
MQPPKVQNSVDSSVFGVAQLSPQSVLEHCHHYGNPNPLAVALRFLLPQPPHCLYLSPYI